MESTFAEIIILTKSSKHGGYCVAGLGAEDGVWYRLVTSRDDTRWAVSEGCMTYKDGSPCQPLDIARIYVKEPLPSKRQPENILIDTRLYWEKTGESSLDSILSIHPGERRNFLLGNDSHRLRWREMMKLGRSLELVYAENMVIKKTSSSRGKPKTKAELTYNGIRYGNMSVTDPEYYGVPDGTAISGAFIVASVPDAPYRDGYFYKFIAKIFRAAESDAIAAEEELCILAGS
jgi:hypothetical protein